MLKRNLSISSENPAEFLKRTLKSFNSLPVRMKTAAPKQASPQNGSDVRQN